MEQNTKKPKLVFFQWDHRKLPNFLRVHMQLHVKCLSEFFNVILVNWDCDYQQICDAYQPDLVLFESGHKSNISRKLKIVNTSCYPEIPKLGLHNGDGWCSCRIGFFSDMEQWGVQTFFSISTIVAESTPEIANDLFVWPNFIDSDIFYDYRLDKMIPVLFTGSMLPIYPWRHKIFNKLSSTKKVVYFPHPGYETESVTMLYGEKYARKINASWFGPTCGTIAKEIVRKHFEIPGARSCLITEKTPSLEAAGFIDMQNCIFANEKDVLDKINYLFRNSEELENIIDAGYKLVHTQHTLKQRDQIFQWYNLKKNLKPGYRIVQDGPFEKLRVVKKASGLKNKHIMCNGLHNMLLREGDKMLFNGKYLEAEAFYLNCLYFIPGMSEPKLKLAICSLYMGNAKKAYSWVKGIIFNNLSEYKALDSDPVEWTYLIVALLCQGKLNSAFLRAKQFPSLCHPELDRIRWVVNYLQRRIYSISELDQGFSRVRRHTIHQLPEVTFQNWLSNICTILRNNRQHAYASALSNFLVQQEKFEGTIKSKNIDQLFSFRIQFLKSRIIWLSRLNQLFVFLQIPNHVPGLPPISELDYIIRLCRAMKIDKFKRYVIGYLDKAIMYWK